MPHLLATMTLIQPGSPAAYASLALAALTATAVVIVTASKARAWVCENAPRRSDEDRDER